MTDLATRTRQWLDGTVTPGPNGGRVADARWLGLGGKVFILPDDAARAAYLDLATRHASRAGITRVARHLLSTITATLWAVLALTIGLAGGTPSDPGGLLLALVATLLLASALRVWSSRNAAELQAWLRQAGAEFPEDPGRARVTLPRGPRGGLVLALDLVAIGLQIGMSTALTAFAAACAGWLPVPVSVCTGPWLLGLLPVLCWGLSGWNVVEAWKRHRPARG